MESFKFFSKNNNNSGYNSGVGSAGPTGIAGHYVERTYNDLERGWCETIFYMSSHVDNIIEGRKYRIHHINDELRFVVTNVVRLISAENFEPIKRFRVLFSVNDINIYTLMITSTNDMTDMLEYQLRLSNGNEMTEFNRYGGF